MSTLDNQMALLCCALFDNSHLYDMLDENVILDELAEMERQAVLPLIAPILKSLDLSDKHYRVWQEKILKYVAINARINNEERRISDLFKANNITHIILKGTSFAQYYPNSGLRVRGDIDLLVDERDFEKSKQLLINEKYRAHVKKNIRNIELNKNDIEVELHRFFTPIDRQSEYFNVTKAKWISSGIPTLPAVENVSDDTLKSA